MGLHHIICIHGIGQHSNTWTADPDDQDESFEALLRRLWDRYGLTNKKGPFDECIKVHAVHYSDEIDKLFQSWKNYSDQLKSSLKFSEPLSGQVAWFTDAIDDAAAGMAAGNYGYTHLMDLLIFAGSATLQDRLVNYTAGQIMQIIQNMGDFEKASLIGHSMGSAMAHKALQLLFNASVDTPSGPARLSGNFRFDNVTMVANTSYALSRNRSEHYSELSKVRPSLSAGQGCCSTWINVNHHLDPVGRFMPFDARKNPLWLDPDVAVRRWAQDITLTKISSKQIHAINHYFRDPALHLPFLDLALDITIPQPERTRALNEFAQSTPEGAFKTVKEQLTKLDLGNTQSFKDFYEALIYAKTQLGVLK